MGEQVAYFKGISGEQALFRAAVKAGGCAGTGRGKKGCNLMGDVVFELR